MRIAFGTDERTPLSDEVAAALAAAGHEVVLRLEDEPWPDVGRRVGEAVAAGEADRGVVCCWTGTGVSIAANKVPGVRAATAHDPYSAERARKSNNAQVLTMGARVIAPEAAEKVLDHWLTAEFEPGPSSPKVAKLEALDDRYRPSGT